jgi:hypothetical protein
VWVCEVGATNERVHVCGHPFSVIFVPWMTRMNRPPSTAAPSSRRPHPAYTSLVPFPSIHFWLETQILSPPCCPLIGVGGSHESAWKE